MRRPIVPCFVLIAIVTLLSVWLTRQSDAMPSQAADLGSAAYRPANQGGVATPSLPPPPSITPCASPNPYPAPSCPTTPTPPQVAIEPVSRILAQGCTSVTVGAGLALLGCQDSLRLFDVSQPSQPRFLARLDVTQPIRAIKLENGRAYLAEGDPDDYSFPNRGALQIVDVRDPASPRLESTLPITPQGGVAIDVLGSRTYLGAAYAGPFFLNSLLRVVDVADPAQPRIQGQIIPNGYTLDLRAVDNRIYVAGSVAGGLDIIDVSDPATPNLVGHYTTEAQAVDVAPPLTYVATSGYFSGWRGLQILYVGDPSQPYIVGQYPTPRIATSVRISGQRAYLIARDLYVLDVADPDRIRLLGQYSLPSSVTAQGLSIAGDLVYVVSQDGLLILRVRNLQPVGTPSLTPTTSVATATATPSPITPSPTMSPIATPQSTPTPSATPPPGPTVTPAPTSTREVCDPSNPANLCNGVIAARIFFDLGCDRFYNRGTDSLLPDTPVTLTMADGQSQTARSGQDGRMMFSNIRILADQTVTLRVHDVVAPAWVGQSGLSLAPCRNNADTRTLTRADFDASGMAQIDFRFSVGR